MDFNDYTSTYVKEIKRSVPLVGTNHRVFLAEKASQLVRLASRHFEDGKRLRVLDVGCGIGLMEHELQGRFEHLIGVDIADEALELARETLPESEFIHYDGTVLPFDDEVFDVAFAVCVFHHVPIDQRQQLIDEMARVVSHGGLLVIFEHNPLNPMTQWIVSRCEIDQDAILLGRRETCRLLSSAGIDRLMQKQILYFPWRGPFWTWLESCISWIPLGAQYYVAGSKHSAGNVLRNPMKGLSSRRAA